MSDVCDISEARWCSLLSKVLNPPPSETWKQKLSGYTALEQKFYIAIEKSIETKRWVIYMRRGGWGSGQILDSCPYCTRLLGTYVSRSPVDPMTDSIPLRAIRAQCSRKWRRRSGLKGSQLSTLR